VDTWREPVVTRRDFTRSVTSGSRSAGRRLFYENCASCHGDEAEGGIGPSLKSPEFLKLADNKFLHRTLTNGRRGTAMAAYNYLGAKALGDIVAYLRSGYGGVITGTDNRKINGSEFNGQKLYARVCAQCHGDDGSGYVGPAIASEGFLASVSDQFIWEMAAYGRSGTQMKGNLSGQNGTADLTKKELNDIVAFIRTHEGNPPRLAARSTLPGEHRNGRDDFARLCAQCHGQGGGGGNGPAIGRKGFLDQVSDGFVVAMMMSGRDGTEMKKFGRGGLVELDANTAAGIVNYLRMKDESEVGPKYVVGTPQIGEEIYVGQCRQCHDQGSFAPDLKRPSFIRAASAGYLQATMTLGRHQSAMRSMVRGGGGLTELSGKEINDIIAYLQQGKE
jgi:mono/diheme cytochrome c family protein